MSRSAAVVGHQIHTAGNVSGPRAFYEALQVSAGSIAAVQGIPGDIETPQKKETDRNTSPDTRIAYVTCSKKRHRHTTTRRSNSGSNSHSPIPAPATLAAALAAAAAAASAAGR